MNDTFVVFDTSIGNFVVELYNKTAPLTVGNFLSYVEAPSGASYAGSFFHRLAPGFVLQGGGYAVSNNAVVQIPTKAPVQNEYSASDPNVAGTIAMAKRSGDPNSATDQFFFNLADNSSNLDNQNGGFSVFGKVVENWNVILALGNLPVENLSSPFDQLPVVGTVGRSGVTLSNLATFSVAVVLPIGNTQSKLPVLDDATTTPFSIVNLTDPGNPGGVGDTITLAINDSSGKATSSPGTLSLPLTGSGGLVLLPSGTGSYVLSGATSLASLQAALQCLVYTPSTLSGQASSITVTFGITLQTPGGEISNQDTSVVVSHDAVGPVVTAVQNVAQAILRVPLVQSDAVTAATQIVNGTQTLGQFTTTLISSEQALYTTLPALVTIDAMYGATPSSAVLTTAASATGSVGYYTAAGLHALGYSDPNVWTIMGSEWSADKSSSFYTLYNGYGSNYSAFISAVYQREFGYVPSSANLANLLGDVSGVQSLLAGPGGSAAAIQVVGGIYGYLLYVGQTYSIGQYGTAANAFLLAAANGTVTYGQELTVQFPTSIGPVTSSMAGLSAQVVAVASGTNSQTDPNIIMITGTDHLIDPGTGSFTMQFLDGASADTVVMHTGGVDQVVGFDLTTDVLDLRSWLAETLINSHSDATGFSRYLTITDQGADAVLSFSPPVQGSNTTIAVLRGLGSTVTSLDTLVAAGALRVV